MDTRELRAATTTTTKGIRKRKAAFDLNVPPRDQEGTSIPINVNLQEDSVHIPTIPMIDVDEIEDDVVESSASAFAEAKSKSTSLPRGPLVVDLESGRTSRLPANISTTTSTKRRRSSSFSPTQTVINIIEPDVSPPPPEQPKFSCPICLCPFTEEVSTKCGHIFCKLCIKTSISKSSKCPSCRKKITARELIRVFLPSTR